MAASVMSNSYATNEEKKDEKEIDPEEEEIAKAGGGICSGISTFGKGAKCFYFFGILASIINGCVFPSFSVLFQNMTDALFDPTADLKEEALTIMIQFIIVGAAALVLSLIQFSTLGYFGTHVGVEIRKVYFDKLLRQEIAYYDKHNSGTLNSELIANTNAITVAIGSKTGFAVQNLTQFFAGFAVAFYFSWNMALILLACLPVLAIVGVIQGKVLMGGGNDADPFTKSGSFTNEVLLNIKTVTANPRLLAFKLAQYGTTLDKAYPSAKKRAVATGFGLGGMMLGMFGVMYSIGLYFGSKMVDDGKITVGEMLGCFFGFLIGGTSLGQIGSVAEDFNKAKKALNKVFYLMKKKINIINYENSTDYQNIHQLDTVNKRLRGDIEFKNVTFAYPEAPNNIVLNKISFNIKSGSTLAIVGPSGSGKSTTVGLIERFYDLLPKCGEILIDGKNIIEYDLNFLRLNVGYVSQLPLLFGESVKENIKGGNNNVTMDDIVNASKFAQCHDFINENLPKGYDTLCGEMGDRLSGGQRQRISIAKAIVTKPCILLFDEATSALDTKSEREVQKAIDKITESHNQTIITIAHRLSTIKNADLILVMVDGNIVQKGNHNQLIEDKNGVYYTLVQSQRIIEQNKQENI